MPQILKGAPVARDIREECGRRAAALRERGIVPTLCILRVGERPDDVAYEASAMKKCEQAGVRAISRALPEGADTQGLLAAVDRLNEDDSVHGVLLLRPLPRGVDEDAAKERLLPQKDVDCMGDGNLYRVLGGDESGFLPCTPQAVVRILDHYGISLEGKEAVVIGRSLVVGKPLSMMLLSRNATVTICHSRTANLAEVCRRADVLVCAAGVPGMVDRTFVKPGAIVVDVGIHLDGDGKLTGDARFDSVQEVAGGTTPVPGGVGSVTSWLLVEHVIRACETAKAE
ncbi:bifunctional 5,10-methylenetetrahydrofolate dehydrogenase/5,10-methenyltetrahydrofolate cyclohydrolase [Christensenella sp. MSJ-20]|uniref:bifunctional 5,10-methylenetetrahydrofolate dehydrogenase/5,10-methenyltetrahydrofolate cyclohydrolase n=1 Tax=Christensenella sp. MSJ-20 TaxID=2841518 RepID=UPI000D78F7C6|nr:MAG: bifunctional 5,10-methylene-tetrahydrofolate dehydrogenase/5,10-methylene-tetrahydrofolate cyclohydrolase [Bacillota bacterium]QWT55390.1 bifunctional 5,10-methylenetetrahydrofolate dehydrogenase/5,10-methenyltetrahydrofolate cyclohydrolase [Christensenella sp. MSJ-20]